MSIPPRQCGFFDREQQIQQNLSIYQLNDFLRKLNALINWEIFRPTLNQVREKEHRGPGGRPPFDVVLMFKIHVLKSLGNEVLRTIGFGRARFWIGLRNLMYNMNRFVSLKYPRV